MGKAGLPAVADQLYAEIAFVAYHFHWSYGEILAMEHAERRRWCEEISKINKVMNTDERQKNGSSLELAGRS
ncbi:DUF6760 family protein [Collimonas silvisoli]|uniref:DUF6760 family protein n=1 Tax=Collimonas silvisoli TaxID=2825884 RepID=UPI002E788530|nr:DUF6760 family protein [Collimonas silvisoli]